MRVWFNLEARWFAYLSFLTQHRVFALMDVLSMETKGFRGGKPVNRKSWKNAGDSFAGILTDDCPQVVIRNS